MVVRKELYIITPKRFCSSIVIDLHHKKLSSHTPSSVPDFSSGVIFKLMSFTFAMITLPIGTYFFTNAYVFNGESSRNATRLSQEAHVVVIGNATYAGGLAALMANVVLIGYVIMAFMDDQKEQAEEAEKEKKKL